MNFIKKSNLEGVTLYKLGSALFGRPKVSVYSFLVDNLLIDTGHPKIGKDFAQALKSEVIDRIILTHHHEDHSGNVEALKKAKGVPVYASPLCCRLIENPKRIEPARIMSWGQPKKATAQALDLTEDIVTSNYRFKILETPGHAIDQISLYEADKGWLFSGDIFVHHYIKAFMKDEDMLEQINSIKKLLQLDFDVLFCNHQPVFKNGKARLASKLDFLESFYHSVKTEYTKGQSPKQIMKSLQLKEQRILKFLSLGQLSQLNMVTSAIRSF